MIKLISLLFFSFSAILMPSQKICCQKNDDNSFLNYKQLIREEKQHFFDEYQNNKNECRYSINEEKTAVLDRLLSNEPFTINGKANCKGKTININKLYDFLSMDRFEIADFLYECNFINEEEHVFSYQEIVKNRYFDNIKCLNNYYEKYMDLSSNINSVVNPFSFNHNQRSTYTIYGTHFQIEYQDTISSSESTNMLNCLEYLYAYFSNLGFRLPFHNPNEDRIEIYLESASSPDNDCAALTIGMFYLPTILDTNDAWSKITFYNFSSFTQDVQKITAHEYFHCIQNAYNLTDAWFQEAYANLIQLIVFGLRSRDNYDVNAFINSGGALNNSSTEYGAMVYQLTLYEEYGGIETVRKFYEEYDDYPFYVLTTNVYPEIIENVILSLGYTDSFEDTIKKMSGYLYNPEDFYSNYSDSNSWSNTSIEDINMAYNNSHTTSLTLNSLCRKYYSISVSNDFYGRILVQVNATNTGTFVAIRNWGNNYELIDPLQNGTTYSHSFVLNNTHVDHDLGFVLYNPNTNVSQYSDINITIQLINTETNTSFLLNTRYYEKQINLLPMDNYKIEISSAVSKYFIIQTLGSTDTYLIIKDSQGITLSSNDDGGYSTNAFTKQYFNSNTTYYIYLKCYSVVSSGITKLVIVPSTSYDTNFSTNVTSFSSIYSINNSGGNFIQMTQLQNQVRMITFTPTVSHSYRIATTGNLDTFMYLLEMTDTANIIDGYSFSDEEGEDGDGNAGIYRYLYSGKTYLIIVSDYLVNSSSGNFNLVIYSQ